MFTSKVKEDIVQVVPEDLGKPYDFHTLNTRAVEKLNQVLDQKRDKTENLPSTPYSDDYFFTPRRDPVYADKLQKKLALRHTFGIAIFGSATTKNLRIRRAPIRWQSWQASVAGGW